jgi:uncharacterized protein YjeT (DUF2065 family)
MTPAARSMYVFGIYATLAGVTFLVAPAQAVSLLQLSPIASGWLRVIGMFGVIIGLDDVVAARAECLPFLKLSVPLRYGFATGIITLVATGQLTPPTLTFGVIDIIGASWTLLGLRAATARRVAAS